MTPLGDNCDLRTRSPGRKSSRIAWLSLSLSPCLRPISFSTLFRFEPRFESPAFSLFFGLLITATQSPFIASWSLFPLTPPDIGHTSLNRSTSVRPRFQAALDRLVMASLRLSRPKKYTKSRLAPA
ncbi:hypothetical protein D8B26_004766 [Coccidioides posadasii str. Silveira]|uniref:uncharacterized protein n=1 Tax=Coccidioides posadasii (strain RMSCC 757 / Silveira) TaxID=443226 RepID=UPI001BF09443|nr:hypothetical protein D8B26_004766 [Coccidioides posadasii str. Silveira]